MRLSEDHVRQLCAEYENGVTTRTIASRYGIGKTTVTRLLREHGVPLRYQGLSPEQAQQAIQLYEAGLSVAKAARELGLPINSVYDALKAAGTEMRARHERHRR
jgi:transposase-like protein